MSYEYFVSLLDFINLIILSTASSLFKHSVKVSLTNVQVRGDVCFTF